MINFRLFKKINLVISFSLILTIGSLGFVYYYSKPANSYADIIDLPIEQQLAAFKPTISKKFFDLPLFKGIEINDDDFLNINFYIDSMSKKEAGLKETKRLINYFLAGLAIKKDDLWVNLSPYEPERIIPESLSNLELGQNLLLQDYILKQITTMLSNPDNVYGSKFWAKVNRIVPGMKRNMALSKVWIVPDSIKIFERKRGKKIIAFIKEAKLKLMLEEDYSNFKYLKDKRDNKKIRDVFKQQLLPIIEREVNFGINFAPLRQIYYSIILATYLKQKLKKQYFFRDYIDSSNTDSIKINNDQGRASIYQAYVKNFQQGMYKQYKQEYIFSKQRKVKYFSGGDNFKNIDKVLKVIANDPNVNTSIEGNLFRLETKGLVKPYSQTQKITNSEKPSEAETKKSKEILTQKMQDRGKILEKIIARKDFLINNFPVRSRALSLVKQELGDGAIKIVKQAGNIYSYGDIHACFYGLIDWLVESGFLKSNDVNNCLGSWQLEDNTFQIKGSFVTGKCRCFGEFRKLSIEAKQQKLKQLIDNINFQQADTLVFTGDLISRGNDNWEVLEFMRLLKEKADKETNRDVIILLGNHDLLLYQILRKLELDSGQIQKDQLLQKIQDIITPFMKGWNKLTIDDFSHTISGLINIYAVYDNDSIDISQTMLKLKPITSFLAKFNLIAVVNNLIFTHNSLPGVKNINSLDQLAQNLRAKLQDKPTPENTIYLCNLLYPTYYSQFLDCIGQDKHYRENIYDLVEKYIGLRPVLTIVGHDPYFSEIEWLDDLVFIDSGNSWYFRWEKKLNSKEKYKKTGFLVFPVTGAADIHEFNDQLEDSITANQNYQPRFFNSSSLADQRFPDQELIETKFAQGSLNALFQELKTIEGEIATLEEFFKDQQRDKIEVEKTNHDENFIDNLDSLIDRMDQVYDSKKIHEVFNRLIEEYNKKNTNEKIREKIGNCLSELIVDKSEILAQYLKPESIIKIPKMPKIFAYMRLKLGDRRVIQDFYPLIEALLEEDAYCQAEYSNNRIPIELSSPLRRLVNVVNKEALRYGDAPIERINLIGDILSFLMGIRKFGSITDLNDKPLKLRAKDILLAFTKATVLRDGRKIISKTIFEEILSGYKDESAKGKGLVDFLAFLLACEPFLSQDDNWQDREYVISEILKRLEIKSSVDQLNKLISQKIKKIKKIKFYLENNNIQSFLKIFGQIKDVLPALPYWDIDIFVVRYVKRNIDPWFDDYLKYLLLYLKDNSRLEKKISENANPIVIAKAIRDFYLQHQFLSDEKIIGIISKLEAKYNKKIDQEVKLYAYLMKEFGSELINIDIFECLYGICHREMLEMIYNKKVVKIFCEDVEQIAGILASNRHMDDKTQSDKVKEIFKIIIGFKAYPINVIFPLSDQEVLVNIKLGIKKTQKYKPQRKPILEDSQEIDNITESIEIEEDKNNSYVSGNIRGGVSYSDMKLQIDSKDEDVDLFSYKKEYIRRNIKVAGLILEIYAMKPVEKNQFVKELNS